MDKDAVKELIARIVADIQGCKATELPVHIANHVNPTVRQQVFDNNFDFPDLLQEMSRASWWRWNMFCLI